MLASPSPVRTLSLALPPSPSPPLSRQSHRLPSPPSDPPDALQCKQLGQADPEKEAKKDADGEAAYKAWWELLPLEFDGHDTVDHGPGKVRQAPSSPPAVLGLPSPVLPFCSPRSFFAPCSRPPGSQAAVWELGCACSSRRGTTAARRSTRPALSRRSPASPNAQRRSASSSTRRKGCTRRGRSTPPSRSTATPGSSGPR